MNSNYYIGDPKSRGSPKYINLISHKDNYVVGEGLYHS